MVYLIRTRWKLGYRDSGADIAYSLQLQSDIDVLTATPSPSPNDEDGWCFPDTEEGIMLALEKGATHLWANTVLFTSHPLQSSSLIGKYQDLARVFGQPPTMVEKYDDKEFVNNLLRSKGGFTMPKSWSLSKSEDVKSRLRALNLPFPVVVKPIRGRGSYGVRMCTSEGEVTEQIKTLFEDSLAIMIEEYLAGEEITITVMPPSEETPRYWAMPIVKRFNHADGIAPYSGVIAVTSNSTVIPSGDYAKCPSYHKVTRQCEEVAKLLRVTAPIRIDARRFTNDQNSDFALFDVNMKPVCIFPFPLGLGCMRAACINTY